MEELDALERLLARAASGSGRAVLVAGEAGIGKSRLVAELEERARGRGVRVLVGECVELAEGELAFAPIISALREVMEEPQWVDWLEGPQRSALAALWPVVGGGESQAGGREQLFEGVYRVLARVAAERPVLLIVEDVHWIDPSSRDLLAFLVRNARHDRIAVLATYRPDELHRGHPLRPFVTELERSGRAERVDLVPLKRSEVAEQLEAIAGRAPAGDVIGRIFARCEGNPFFAEELLASADTDDRELPGSLREALLLRIERLPELSREVLRVAAVVGRSVDHRLLETVVGVAEPDLLAALRESADHHVLVPSAGGTAYVFRHALLREAIYDDTLIGERLRLHRAIAANLEAHREYAGVAAAAELAYHWLAAGEERAALSASVEAATEAEAMHAYGEGLGHATRALALWDRVERPEAAVGFDRAELLLRGSDLADYAGDAETALALAERARAGIDEGLQPLRAATAERKIAKAMMYGGRATDALEHLVRARQLVPNDPPSLEYAEVLSAEGRMMMVLALMREARERLEEVIPLTELLGAQALKAGSLSALALVYANLGERERAIPAGREAVRLAEQADSAEQLVRAYINGSQAIDDSGRIEEALALGIEGIAAAERVGMSRGAGDQLREQAAWRLQRIGRLAEAERMIQPALENATTPFAIAGALCFAGRISIDRGDLDLGHDRLERAWALMQRSGGFQLIGPAMAAQVLLEIRRSDLRRARERVREGLQRAGGAQASLIYNAELYWLATRVEAELGERARVIGDHAAVRECEQAAGAALAELDQSIGEIAGDGPPPEALAFHALAKAELTRLRAERDAEPWDLAADRFRGVGVASHAAYAQLRSIEARVLLGARPLAVAGPLRAVHAAALEIGSRPFLEEVLALARRVGVPLGAPGEGPNREVVAELGLTDRELEVLRLLGDGRTNRQIGEELFITPKTASVHVSRILMKLGVANRAEAAAAAHRLGLARHVSVP